MMHRADLASLLRVRFAKVGGELTDLKQKTTGINLFNRFS